MSNFKFELNKKGVGDLLKSTEMQTVLESYSSGIRQRAGEGYEHDVQVNPGRAHALVWADTYQAKSDNSKNNTLLKAVK